MSNLFGIALDQAWLRWAAAEGVTETVIAAVSLLHERSVEEVAGKLMRGELADVTRLVSRCPNHYPPGAFDALKARRTVAAEQSATRTTASWAPIFRPGGTSAHLSNWAHTPNELALLNEPIARTTRRITRKKPGHIPGRLDNLRRRMVVEDLRGTWPKHSRHRGRNGDIALLGP